MADAPKCRDFGDRPGCLGTADERYTMDFGDVEPGAKIHWCSHCGPEAHAMNDALMEALETRGPAFAAEFEKAVDEAMAARVVN